MIDLHEGLPKISASRIATYRLCAKKYQLNYLLRDTERDSIENIYALRGAALHKAIELHYTEGKNPTTVFQDVFNSTIEEWQTNHVDIRGMEDATRLFTEGKKMIQQVDWSSIDPLHIERRFLLPFPSIEEPICYIDGVIDVETKDDRVIDHKSKKGKTPDIDAIAQDPQFLLYYWAFHQLNNKYPKGVFWHHLQTGVMYNTHIEDGYSAKMERLREDIDAMLHATQFARKSYDNFCKGYCPFYTTCYPKGTQESLVIVE